MRPFSSSRLLFRSTTSVLTRSIQAPIRSMAAMVDLPRGQHPGIAAINGQFAQINLSRPADTPKDYAQYSFELPQERYVGLLKCQLDPNARQLETVVVRCEKQTIAVIPRSNGKEKGKQKPSKDGIPSKQDVWEVELLDTVLFPEGGGQASDFGTITPLDGEALERVQVTEVVRRDLRAIHFCSAPLKAGSRVLVEVDWPRRLDLCTQHTSQHLLSGVLEHHYKLPTLGWALSAFPSLSYVELPRCPTPEELANTEEICNTLIREGRRVRIELKLSQDDERPESLPADYIGGVVRTVIIDDLDANPCCGTHFHSLAPLQGLHVSPYTTPIRGTNTRVFFMAGPRIHHQLQISLGTLRRASVELSCSQEIVDKRVAQTNENLKDALKREKRLRDEVAESVALRAIAEARKRASSDSSLPLLGAHVREEDATNDMDFLSAVSVKIKDLLAEDARPYAFALAQSGNSTPSPDGCLLIFGTHDSTLVRISDAMKKGTSSFGSRLKGGGKGRWQGKLVEGRFRKSSDEQALLQSLEEASRE